jgi:hypothetical protein
MCALPRSSSRFVSLSQRSLDLFSNGRGRPPLALQKAKHVPQSDDLALLLGVHDRESPIASKIEQTKNDRKQDAASHSSGTRRPAGN